MGMPIRKNKSAAYKFCYVLFLYRGPVWVDEIDPIWITVAPKGSPHRLRALYKMIIVSYNDNSAFVPL